MARSTIRTFVAAAANQFHRTCARSRLATTLALKVRNQCNSIIGYALGDDAEVTDALNSERWLLQQVAEKIDVFVDVGANIGDWTEAMMEVRPAARGVLFEPVEWCFVRLCEKFGANSRLTLRKAAVGAASGRAAFCVAPENAKTSSFVVGGETTPATSTQVEVTTIDELNDEMEFGRIHLLKVDCEGFDLDVLRGATNMLRAAAIDLIQFEYNTMWPIAGNTLASALRLLGQHNYEAYLLKNRRLQRFDYATWGEFARFSNFVAYPRGGPMASLLTPNGGQLNGQD